jgi:hypothetical protein
MPLYFDQQLEDSHAALLWHIIQLEDSHAALLCSHAALLCSHAALLCSHAALLWHIILILSQPFFSFSP